MPDVAATPPPGGWVPYLALIVALLAPLGPVWLTNRNARAAKRAAEVAALKCDENAEKTARKLEEIQKIVDGTTLTAAQERIDFLETQLIQAEASSPPHPPQESPERKWTWTPSG